MEERKVNTHIWTSWAAVKARIGTLSFLLLLRHPQLASIHILIGWKSDHAVKINGVRTHSSACLQGICIICESVSRWSQVKFTVDCVKDESIHLVYLTGQFSQHWPWAWIGSLPFFCSCLWTPDCGSVCTGESSGGGVGIGGSGNRSSSSNRSSMLWGLNRDDGMSGLVQVDNIAEFHTLVVTELRHA